MIERHVTAECERLSIDRREFRFSQRNVREMSAWTDFQVKTHMRKLVEMEYLLIHRGGRGQSFVYELMYRGEGEGGRPFLMGLVDVAKLAGAYGYDTDREHRNAEPERSGSSKGAAGEHGGSDGENALNASADAKLRFPKPKKREKARHALTRKTPVVHTRVARDGNGRAEA